MTQINIQDIENNFDLILQQTGTDSYVNWESFTKNSTQFVKTLDQLAKNIAILRDINHRKFISTMKKLKSSDIPDLIKTVKAKKLPKEALKTIISRFKLNEGKVQLVDTVQELKNISTSTLNQYIQTNNQAAQKAKEAVDFLNEKIKNSGLYEQPEQMTELVSTFKHQFDEAKLQAAKKNILIQQLPGTVNTIHITTYSQIVDNSFEVVKSQYLRLTTEARAKQRSNIKQTPKYLENLTQYLTNTEVLILEGQKAIAFKIGLSDQHIEDAQTALMERGLAQNILMIQSALRSKVKQSIPCEKEVSLQKAKEILGYQISLLLTKIEYFKELFNGLQKNQSNLQLVPMILALALNDMVFQKYALEEQDIMKNVTDQVIMTNPQFAAIFKEMEITIIKLMEQIKLIPQNVSQYMQNQALPSNNMQTPPSNMATGVLPGSNPMDLLQFQQYQQFYQMQQQAQLAQLKK